MFVMLQTTIGEIQTQMQENHERNKQLREENFDLAGKLKKFIEQSEAREQVGNQAGLGLLVLAALFSYNSLVL